VPVGGDDQVVRAEITVDHTARRALGQPVAQFVAEPAELGALEQADILKLIDAGERLRVQWGEGTDPTE
jgi:hypothetical protein